MSIGTMHPKSTGHVPAPTIWLLGLLVALLIVAIGYFFARPQLLQAPTSVPVATLPAAADPAQAGVLGYVAAHQAARAPAAAADPAQMGVMSYLRAHGATP